jgi:hypothetical protein
MFPMQQSTGSSWHALVGVARWEQQQCADGPIARLLVHLVADPRRRLRGEDACVWLSARLLLRDGKVWALSGKCERAALLAVLQTAAGILAGRLCIQIHFDELDGLIAQALCAAGFCAAVIELDRSPGLSARPAIDARQLARLALHALNLERAEEGERAVEELPAILTASFRLACALDGSQVRAWEDALDGQARALTKSLLSANGIPADSVIVYNFLTSGHGNSRNRVQAARAMPWLLPVLLSSAPDVQAVVQCRPVDAILAAVDAGVPLVRALGKVFGVPRSAVRHLAAVAPPAGWTLDVERVRRLLFLLSCLPPERRPSDDGDYAALVKLGNTLHRPLAFLETADLSLEQAAHAVLGAWFRQLTAAGLTSAVLGDAFAQLAIDLADAGDYLRALCEFLRADDVPAAVACEQVLAFCVRITLRRLLALSRQWHARLPAATDKALRQRSWPALLRQPWEHPLRNVVELTSSYQLHAEGQDLVHCVAAFGAACSDGESVIVSLRSLSAVPLSTAELCVREDPPRVRIVQHRSRSNGVPEPACVEVLDALLRHLNDAGQVPVLNLWLAFHRQRTGSRTIPGRDGASCLKFGTAARQFARRLAGSYLPPPATTSTSCTTILDHYHAAITH